MYTIRMTRTFRKDTERCRKRGYDMELLKTAIRTLETNGQLPASYRPPVPHRGESNTPVLISHVYDFISNAREISVEELNETVDKNIKTLFAI